MGVSREKTSDALKDFLKKKYDSLKKCDKLKDLIIPVQVTNKLRLT
jgi:hypothetical protein